MTLSILFFGNHGILVNFSNAGVFVSTVAGNGGAGPYDLGFGVCLTHNSNVGSIVLSIPSIPISNRHENPNIRYGI